MKNFGKTLIDLVAGGFLKGVEGIIDELDISKDKKDQAKIAMRRQEIDFQMKLSELELERMQEMLEDRANARGMYGKDAQVQKVYAIVFLAGYLVLTVGLLLMVFEIADVQLDVPDWGVGIIGSIWGGMTSKVNTITDFFFGSSQGSKAKTDIINIKENKKPDN